jgi:membrane protease YdiL (CAAX protease family)
MGTRAKILAIAEVILIRFGLLAIVQIGLLRIPGFMDWQLNTLGYPFTTGVVFILSTLLLLLITRRDLKAYGLNFENLHYHLGIAGTCFIPFVLIGIPQGLGVDYRGWSGAFILAALQIGLLFVIAWLLKKKASLGLPTTAGALFLFVTINPALDGSSIGKAIAAFVYFLFFVGFSEEMLYRGYIESRLNEAFPRPYRFFDVHWGWGTILGALIFGLSHVGMIARLIGEANTLTWAWGFWTFFGGLVFSYIRQKTGSILAPAVLHGGPQAIVTTIMALGFIQMP